MESVATVVLGLGGLVFASSVAVERSRRIARRLGVTELIIGLVVVSIGTSLPEIALNVSAGLTRLGGMDASGLAVGNVIGSCLTQITLILGISGLVATLYVPRRSLLRDGGIMFGSILLMLGAAVDGELSRLEGVGLVLIYLAYLYVLSREERTVQEEPELKGGRLWVDGFFLVGALVVVVVTSSLVVGEGVALAEGVGISQFAIGLMAGVGTSLPELSISVGALGKGAKDLSLGNLIGSNITDPLLSLGLGAAVAGYSIDAVALGFDFAFWIFATLVALLLLWNHVDLNRKESSVLLLTFGMYVFLKATGL